MGNTPVTKELSGQILKSTEGCFQSEEITKLFRRFSELNPSDDKDKQPNPDGLIPFEKVLKLHELEKIPLTRMVLKLMAPNDDKITFKQFVELVWIFCSSSPYNLKHNWFSRCLTTNGKVDENKTFAFFKTQLHPNFQDDFILQVCQNIFDRGNSLEDCFSKDDVAHHMTGYF